MTVGRNIRRFRILQGFTQTEVARLAGVTVSTVYHVEKGVPTRRKSVLALCQALQTCLDDIGVRSPQPIKPTLPYVIHRGENTFWRAPVDHRRWVPEDNSQRISDPVERRRLGALGLVPIFVGYLSLIMPEGPGVMQIELHGRYSNSFNQNIYQKSIMHCLTGGVRLKIGEDVVELSAGDYVGCATDELCWIEPLGQLPTPNPSIVFWSGAVRIGRVVEQDKPRIVRKSKANKRSTT